MSGRNAEAYRDIIEREHPTSLVHPRMPMEQRAAQFSPFAALTGYEDMVEETARLTQPRRELDENELERLDQRLRLLREHLGEHPVVRVLYFAADARKQGGSYEAVSGQLLRMEEFPNALVLQGGRRIPVEDLYALEGEIFEERE
jgi:hypothetical protein